jgi:uncharacterized oxidoreductase
LPPPPAAFSVNALALEPGLNQVLYCGIKTVAEYFGGIIMNLAETVRPGASQYIGEAGSLSQLKEKLSSFSHPVILTGQKSWAVFQKHYAAEGLGKLELPVYHYQGEAAYEYAEELSVPFQKEKADLILAIGGGKLIDTAKLLSDRINIDFATVPTLISNCAGITPITACYKPNHEFVRVDYHRHSAFFTIVDYNMLLDAPEEYFVAGIGDTLAKWYEAEAIMKAEKGKIPAFAKIGLADSHVIQEVLEKYSADALKSLREHKVTEAFEQVADTVIGLAGTVGGFGTHYCRMAGAHSFHNGLSLIPETHSIQHGAKVAYGILVQLASTGDTDEIKKLLPLYKSIGLPTTLKELHIVDKVDEKLKKVCEFAVLPTEQFILVKPGITALEVRKAVDLVESITNEH